MATEDDRRALVRLTEGEPQRHPLFVGFVGAIGIAWDPIVQAFSESLLRFNYSVEVVHLSKLMDSIGVPDWDELPIHRSIEYYESRMDACDELRKSIGVGSALAALAMVKVRAHRLRIDTSKATSYLFKSLKHPQEVKLLRHVYGDAFFLVGVASSADERRQSLIDALSQSVGLSENPRADTERLIARDELDTSNREFGQNVRDTYAMADVFIPANRGLDNAARDIDRFIEAIFASPFLTPKSHEEGMNFAANASMRSAAAGRQVGAALIPKIGTPVVAGVNEVPKPGGGQYWEGDLPDYRDFRLGRDPNPIYVRLVMEEVLQRLADHEWLREGLCELSGKELFARASDAEGAMDSLLTGARASMLIEFIRCLHAEQAAIVNAARGGISTEQAILYTTTFPCHECAKLIVGAGIREVHYIEPFPKSLVDRLYGEVIDTSPVSQVLMPEGGYRIPFYQFVGIAPRRYASFFIAGERKIGEELVEFNTQLASPRIGYWNDLRVSERESAAVGVIERLLGDIIDMKLSQLENQDHAGRRDESGLRDPNVCEEAVTTKEATQESIQ